MISHLFFFSSEKYTNTYFEAICFVFFIFLFVHLFISFFVYINFIQLLYILTIRFSIQLQERQLTDIHEKKKRIYNWAWINRSFCIFISCATVWMSKIDCVSLWWVQRARGSYRFDFLIHNLKKKTRGFFLVIHSLIVFPNTNKKTCDKNLTWFNFKNGNCTKTKETYV